MTMAEGHESVGQEEVEILDHQVDIQKQILDKLHLIWEQGKAQVEATRAAAAATEHLATAFDAFVTAWTAANSNPITPTSGVLSFQKGNTMPFNVDDTTGDGVFTFTDDHGDPVPAPAGDGSGLVANFASDAPTVCGVGTPVATTDEDGNGGFTVPLTPLSVGSFNLSLEVANASGEPLLDADGTTPFVNPQPINIPVSAGQASTGTLAEQG